MECPPRKRRSAFHRENRLYVSEQMNAKIVTHLSAEIALGAIRPDLFIMRKEIFARIIHGMAEQLNAGIKIEADA